MPCHNLNQSTLIFLSILYSLRLFFYLLPWPTLAYLFTPETESPSDPRILLRQNCPVSPLEHLLPSDLMIHRHRAASFPPLFINASIKKDRQKGAPASFFPCIGERFPPINNEDRESRLILLYLRTTPWYDVSFRRR